MKYFFYLLPLLGSLALAQDPAPRCEDNCPQVKCPSDPVALCQCLNNREILCKKRCPDYIPLTRPCPIKPPTPSLTRTSDPADPSATCECEDMFCAQSYPQSCYCSNNNKKNCYEKCGGVEPEYQVCEEPSNPEPAPSSTLKTQIIPISTPALPVSPPSRTHAACGGFRGNYQQCPPTEMCVKDPYRSGCGPACDQPGICVSQVRCSTRLGLPCPMPGQACVALPDCDPARGGQNCKGVCVYPH